MVTSIHLSDSRHNTVPHIEMQCNYQIIISVRIPTGNARQLPIEEVDAFIRQWMQHNCQIGMQCNCQIISSIQITDSECWWWIIYNIWYRMQYDCLRRMLYICQIENAVLRLSDNEWIANVKQSTQYEYQIVNAIQSPVNESNITSR